MKARRLYRESLRGVCTHIDVSAWLVLDELAGDVLASGAGAWCHLSVILPVPAGRVGEQRRRGCMRHPSVCHQPRSFACTYQNNNETCFNKLRGKQR